MILSVLCYSSHHPCIVTAVTCSFVYSAHVSGVHVYVHEITLCPAGDNVLVHNLAPELMPTCRLYLEAHSPPLHRSKPLHLFQILSLLESFLNMPVLTLALYLSF